MDNDNRKLISIVIPVFNEEEGLAELWNRLHAVTEELDYHWEVLFVDDGSTDNSLAKLYQIQLSDSFIRVISLSRNFGHQPALTAGIDLAQGEAVILMDADLQDRPEAISDFIREWEDGGDVIYAVRTSRQEGYLQIFFFSAFYRILGKLSRIQLPLNAGIFGLLDRRVVNILKAMPERNRYFPGLRAYAGFKQVGVPVDRDARFSGSARVGLKGLIKLAFDAIFSFSYVPIRILTGIGLITASSAFIYIIFIFYFKFVSHKAIEGWASVMGSLLFLGGLQLVMLGVIGEYIARIYEESKHRPYYIIDENKNCEGI